MINVSSYSPLVIPYVLTLIDSKQCHYLNLLIKEELNVAVWWKGGDSSNQNTTTNNNNKLLIYL